MQNKENKGSLIYDLGILGIWFMAAYGVFGSQYAVRKLGDQQDQIDKQQNQIEVLQEKLQKYDSAKMINFNDSVQNVR